MWPLTSDNAARTSFDTAPTACLDSAPVMTPEPQRDGALPHARHGASAGPQRRRAPLVPDTRRGVGRGLDLSVEFLAAILTWAGIGWLADSWLGTAPWLFLGGTLLGMGCGIYLLALRTQVPPRRTTATTTTPEDDQGAS